MNKNLRIFRTFEDGRRVPVGHAENRNGNIVFRYDGENLAAFGDSFTAHASLRRVPPTDAGQMSCRTARFSRGKLA